ncbi:MAG: hypothetical protein FWF46_09340 [Oscillospiraceae bacterium]|nr:hypothetical protein [Oscillospiraceae bacterium]
MDFVTGSYCIDSNGKMKTEDLRNKQEDTSSSGPINPQTPKRKELQNLINTPYEGFGSDYLKRIKKELEPKIHYSLNLNINSINPIAPWTNTTVIKETVERISDFIPPKRDKERKLKDLSNRELWDIAFFIVRNLPRYGKDSAERFWLNSGVELVHQANKSLLETAPMKKLLSAVNLKITSSIFNNGKKVFPIPSIDVTDIIRDNFPSFRSENFDTADKEVYISEIGVFGGVKEVNINGRIEDLTSYTDFASDFSKDIQPYSLIISIKDWFGVDEDDVLNNRLPAVVQRYQLAAFWILQHQRGYKPFVNVLQFDRHHMFARNLKFNR